MASRVVQLVLASSVSQRFRSRRKSFSGDMVRE